MSHRKLGLAVRWLLFIDAIKRKVFFMWRVQILKPNNGGDLDKTCVEGVKEYSVSELRVRGNINDKPK